MDKRKMAATLYSLSSKKAVKYSIYGTAMTLFFALILFPPVLGIAIRWNTMQQFLNQAELTSRALVAVQNSFTIALLVSAADLVTGIPMAWLIARRKSRWITVLDTLSDIPFIVPTAVLGYSLFIFWSDPTGVSSLLGASLVSRGWLLIILLHFAFSYPVVVRVLVGALLDYKREYENASRTLGAPPFTASRTVTFPIIKPSLIAAFILAFSRSISETGATFIVAGTFENGPVFLQNMKNDFTAIPPKVTQASYYGATVFASFILIAVAIIIFFVIRALGPKLRLPVDRVWPTFERKVSYSKAEDSRNSITLLVFFAIVLIPSLYVALPAFSAVPTDTLPRALSGTGIWEEYWGSLLLSYGLAAVATALNVLLGLPMAIMLARRKLGKTPSAVFDVLINIPLVVPSIALGASLKFFWENFAFIPEMLLLIFAHLAITYPYFVRSMGAAVERISPDLEEASKTLGAKPLAVFKTIILPLTKYSMLSGAVIAFTRSVSETGATVAVVTHLRTAPVVLVDWVPRPTATGIVQKIPATPLDVGLGCGFLILFSFIILLTLRLVAKGKGSY